MACDANGTVAQEGLGDFDMIYDLIVFRWIVPALIVAEVIAFLTCFSIRGLAN